MSIYCVDVKIVQSNRLQICTIIMEKMNETKAFFSPFFKHGQKGEVVAAMQLADNKVATLAHTPGRD